MKSIIFFLFFLPSIMFSQSKGFTYDKIVKNQFDTVKMEGVIVSEVYPDSTREFSIWPGKLFGDDEFFNITFLDYHDRIFVKTSQLVFFKEFLDPISAFLLPDRFVVITRNQTFHFIKKEY